jgi:hypothetical protein
MRCVIGTVDVSYRDGYRLDMFDDTRLHEAMMLLGELLSERGQSFDVLAIGGGALLLLGLSQRATIDLDVVARRRDGRWMRSRPLPVELARAVDEVASVLGLPTDKPWLNDGPSFLFEMGLPVGWEARTVPRTFGALTVQLLARDDLIVLKVWAATDQRAPERRARDVGDLRQLAPTRDDLLRAVRWCRAKDGTANFLESSSVLGILKELGVEIDPRALDSEHG